MTRSRTPWLPLLVLPTLAAACLPITVPAGDVQAGSLSLDRPGQVQTFTYWEGDQAKRHLTYRSMTLDETAPVSATNPVVPVLEAATPGNGATDAVTTATASEAEVRAFLRDHWDAHVGGKDDPGLNHQEFLQLLNRNGLTVPQFLQIWRGSRLSLADFERFLGVMDQAMGDADHPDAVRDLRQALGIYRVSLGHLVAALAKVPLSGQTVVPLPEAAVTTFFQRLQAEKATVLGFLSSAVYAKKSLATAVQDLVAMKTLASAPRVQIGIGDSTSYTPSWTAVANNSLTGVTGNFSATTDGSDLMQVNHQDFYSGLRKVTVSTGGTVLQWRLYAKNVGNVLNSFASVQQSNLGEVGVDSLSIPDSRFHFSIKMTMDTGKWLHTIGTSVTGLYGNVIPLPVCDVEDLDVVSINPAGFSKPWELRLVLF